MRAVAQAISGRPRGYHQARLISITPPMTGRAQASPPTVAAMRVAPRAIARTIAFGDVRSGILPSRCSSHPETHPSLRSGPACGCPNSFPTNLSNPRNGLTRLHTFQACSFNRSDTSPQTTRCPHPVRRLTGRGGYRSRRPRTSGAMACLALHTVVVNTSSSRRLRAQERARTAELARRASARAARVKPGSSSWQPVESGDSARSGLSQSVEGPTIGTRLFRPSRLVLATIEPSSANCPCRIKP